MTTVNAICVWLDSTSNPQSAWIVSEDRIELPAGNAETSKTLHVCESREEAVALGKGVAAKRGLPLYENSENAPATLIAE
jgi:hypothetical protein